MYNPSETRSNDITIKNLLEVGCHFGTKKAEWNPKMSPFIFMRRNGVYIINLESTLAFWKRARAQIVENAARGGELLFVGTKKQTQEIIRDQARRCGSPYVENKWLAGTLTNSPVIRQTIGKLVKMEQLVADAESGKANLLKKEVVMLKREIDKMNASLGGIREMKNLPSLIFIADVTKDSLALREAEIAQIPVVALADTNVDPTKIPFMIPANDDATGTVALFSRAIADAVLEGKAIRQKQLEAEAAVKATEPLAEQVITEQVAAEVGKAMAKVLVEHKKSRR